MLISLLAPQGPAAADEPIVLYWAPDTSSLQTATHIVNDVWVEGDRGARPDWQKQSEWVAKGVTPLDWAGGLVYAEEGAEALSTRWGERFAAGYLGIAIDEFGPRDGDLNREMIAALGEVRRNWPDRYIAVWHSGLLTLQLASAYREFVDLVLLESYHRRATGLSLRFAANLRRARRWGIAEKCVMAIGVGPPRGAESHAALRAQVRWARDNAPDMPGIAFYASRATPDLVRYSEDLVREVYLAEEGARD